MIVGFFLNKSPYFLVCIFADDDAHSSYFQHKLLSCLR